MTPRRWIAASVIGLTLGGAAIVAQSALFARIGYTESDVTPARS